VSIDLRHRKQGIYTSIILEALRNGGDIRTLYNRMRRSEVPTHKIGTRSLGWNATIFTSPDAVSCVDRFASRSLSIERVPERRITGPFRLQRF
jgi:hypothetical protein